MKKFVSVFLTFALLITSVPCNVIAEGAYKADASDEEGIIEALRVIESEKENYGLEDIDFEELTYSEAVKTYEYTSDGIAYIRDFVPLKHADKLVAWAIKVEDDNDKFFQISTMYINEINALTDNPQRYALIYDYNACYLFDGEHLRHLGSITTEVENRKTIPSISVLTESLAIDLTVTTKTTPLNYTTANSNARGVVLPYTTYKCNIEHVYQLSDQYKNLCWAACVCCIGNYKKVRTYTLDVVSEAIYYVEKFYNSSDFDHGMWITNVMHIFTEDFRLPYTEKFFCPTPTEVEYSIYKDYPVYGSFSRWVDGERVGHACVIYGYQISNNNPSNRWVLIMDPQEKNTYSVATYTSNGYKYVAVYNNTTWTLTDALMYEQI